MTLYAINESGDVVFEESDWEFDASVGTLMITDDGSYVGWMSLDEHMFLYGPLPSISTDIQHTVESVSGNNVTIRLDILYEGVWWVPAYTEEASGTIMRIMSMGL